MISLRVENCPIKGALAVHSNFVGPAGDSNVTIEE